MEFRLLLAELCKDCDPAILKVIIQAGNYTCILRACYFRRFSNVKRISCKEMFIFYFKYVIALYVTSVNISNIFIWNIRSGK